ncbi:VPS10 domain-containing protein [Flavicella marina]|uniref:VPS10 domain-containing protein n=1 Tax=Flavicella marina TaxID=1475951 RepID=UPI001263FDFA|nr:sialidase family protein [Flavicella marina]
MKKHNAIYYLFCLFSIGLQAQLNEAYFKKLQTQKISSTPNLVWQQFGPGMSGYCEEFWVHPTDNTTLYMSPDMSNSYGSWDNGNSWTTIKDVDGNGKDLRRIKSIDFSRQNSDFGYAIDVRGHLYATYNKGKNWTKVDFISEGRCSQIIVDPNNDNNWYVGTGDFWNVKFNPKSKDRILGYRYKYGDYGKIYRSNDKGKTWKQQSKGLPETLDVARIIVNPKDSKNIIIASNSGVYTSQNQGKTWKTSAKGLPFNHPRDLTHYYNPETGEFILYLIEQTVYSPSNETIKSSGGVYKSLDNGKTWTSITGNLGINLNEIHSYNAKEKYKKSMAYWFGIKKNEVVSKFPKYPSEILSVYNRIRVNPKNKNEIYLSQNVKHDKGFAPGDVWKSNDGGAHWIATTRTGLYWKKGKDVAYWKSRNNPTGMNTQFAHLHEKTAHLEETAGNRFMSLDSDGTVYICIEQQVLRSKDNGISWQQIDDFETEKGSKNWIGRGGSNLPGRYMLLETGIKDRKLFCSGEHGLWQNAPLGNYPDKNAIAVRQIEGQLNYEKKNKGAHSIASVAVSPKDPNTIYILMFRQDHQGYLRKSTDSGKTWKNHSLPIPFDGNHSMEHIFQYSLTIDYENPSNIYFCAIANPISEVSGGSLPKRLIPAMGVYKSSDEGKTWKLANKGFPKGSSVRRIKMDPKNPSILYAALNLGKNNVQGGLYYSKNRGDKWKKVKIPSQIKSVNNIFIDKKTHDMFISCGSERGTLDEGGVWKSNDKGKTWEKFFDMPYIWQTETSPINPDIITVTVALPNENRGASNYNPGAYISLDGGKTWLKANKNMGQPDTITDFKPDPEHENIFWLAAKGSGWYRGVLQQ